MERPDLEPNVLVEKMSPVSRDGNEFKDLLRIKRQSSPGKPGLAKFSNALSSRYCYSPQVTITCWNKR